MEGLRRFCLITDSWFPLTNGVTKTLARLRDQLEAEGIEVQVITPHGHRTFPMPRYREIRLAWDPWRATEKLEAFDPGAIHIATEGPLGVWFSLWLGQRGYRFTTSFHTRWPEYLAQRIKIPVPIGYGLMRWFHGRAERTFVGSRALARQLKAKGVGRELIRWPRGVDFSAFRPGQKQPGLYDRGGPVWLYVGRIVLEKNLHHFLELDLPGTKVLVGDGPELGRLRRAYPSAVWKGYLYGDELAAHYASADCFVFPSRTDTFGNVILEALASGLPVAATPSPGPLDLVEEGVNGALDDNLAAACHRALKCEPENCISSARAFTLEESYRIFREHLMPARASLVASS